MVLNNPSVETKMVSCALDHPDPDVISQAAEVIKKGGLVVYPTDTFYGLGGNPRNMETIRRIFRVKGRSHHKPLPLILDHRSNIKDWVREIPPLAKRLMDHFWPGPLTILFPCSPALSPLITAGTGKIGIRWPAAPVATALARRAGTAIISTSANISGKGSIIHPDALLKDLKGFVDIIIDSGELPPSMGSTIVDATTAQIRIIREGEIPSEKFHDMDQSIGL